MLRSLNIRLKAYTILFIAIFIAFMMLTSYYVSKKILTDNYIEKSVQITKQEAENAIATLKNIEEVNTVVISKLELENPVFYKTHSPDYIRNLTSFNKFYPYFTSFFVYHNNQVLYYYSPTFEQISDYNHIINNTTFNENGVGWFTQAGNSKLNDSLILVRKIPLENEFLYFFFMIDYSYISSHFNGGNDFADHKDVFISAGNNSELCSIKTQIKESNQTKKAFSSLEKTGYSILNKNTIITRSDTDYGPISFYCADDISHVNFYTSMLALIYIALFVISILLAYISISLLSKSMSKQLERLRTKMQNYL